MPPKPVKAIHSQNTSTPSMEKQHKDMRPGPSTVQPSYTPPRSPGSGNCEPTVTMTVTELAKALTKALAEHGSLAATPGSAQGQSSQETNATTISSMAENAQPKKKRASKLSYLAVREVWNKAEYKYKTVKASAAEEIDDQDEYVFVVRERIDRQTEKAVKFIDIKSEAIRDSLRLVLKDVRVVSLKEDKPSIEQRFLFNFLEEIAKYRADKLVTCSQDETASKHLDIFLDYLQTVHGALKTQLHSLLKGSEITYPLLWTIFKPNAEIVTTCPGTNAPRCVRCRFGEERTHDNGTKYFYIQGHYLDFDGETFGEALVALAIEEFRGARRINSLPSYPIIYHRRPSEIKKQLIDHGRKFISLLGVHHRAYEGNAFFKDKEGNIITKFVQKSRIMVDAPFFRRCNPNYRRATIVPSSDDDGFFNLASQFDEDTSSAKTTTLQAVGKGPKAIPEQDLLVCSPTVCGFSLDLKLWLQFAVAHVSDIKWDDSCFDHLAIPDGTKKVVQALCKAHLARDSDLPFADFVAGKGCGFISLLHGPPGVGKTLTAETISEHFHRPFYTISAGDLGITAADLEGNLSNIFELSSHWKATLLLDEADVFVEQRSTSDLHRNALVCIFLRLLEYYDGILFLTTNRVETIDEAFASRIHMPLRYDPLNESARRKVWKGHLDRAVTKHGKAIYSVNDLDELVRKRLNGREITNITSTAQALAAFDNTVVSVKYLTEAMDAGKQFQSDFKGAGHFDNERAYM